MKTLYLDIFSGISGDMFIGALIDLGVDAAQLEEELKKLGLHGYHLHVSRGQKAAIAGTKFDVHLTHTHSHEHTHADGTTHSHEHDHPGHAHEEAIHGAHGGPMVEIGAGTTELSVFETNVPPRFRLYFRDAKGKATPPPAAKTVTLETVRPGGRRQVFKFKQHGAYLEATEELPEPHEFKAILKIRQRQRVHKIQTQFVENHHHHHAHEHGHSHPHDEPAGAGHAHGDSRDFNQIRKLIGDSALSDWVKEKAVAIFERIAVAEGKIHGVPPEEVHFHEVGAVDSIVDIVGACIGLELLGKPLVQAGPVVEGAGWIRCAHGRFPIPAPATLAILGARDIAVSQCDEPNELVTPTGAALLAELAAGFGPMRGVVAQQIGFGLGTRDNITRPNVLRAILGTTTESEGGHDWEIDTVAVLETNLDDLNPEILGHFIEKALAEGALDVFHTAIQMKKNRPGVLLTILCREPEADKFSELVLRETSSFGLRRYVVERRKLVREFGTVQTLYGEVKVKIGRLDGKVVQAAPEYEGCRKLAARAKVPLRQVYEAANEALGENFPK